MRGASILCTGALSLALGTAVLPLPSQASTPSPRISLQGSLDNGQEVVAGVAQHMPDSVPAPPGTPPLKRPDGSRGRAATAIYDVRLFTMATSDGSVSLSDEALVGMVERTDEWFELTTSGAFRFRTDGVVTPLPPSPSPVCGIGVPESAMEPLLPLDVSPGAIDTIWVVVTPGDMSIKCDAAGVAHFGGRGIWMAGHADERHLPRVLAHEIGHNLGLNHSSAVTPSGAEPSWPTDSAPPLTEYGDALDFMGVNGYWACENEQTCRWQLAGIHAHNLNLLGLLPESGITHVPPGEVRTVEISAVDSRTGVRAVYLPWLNRSKFVIDFRPLDFQGGRATGPEGPGAGVVVRLVDSPPDTGPEPYLAFSGTAALSAPSLPPSEVIRIGLGVGGKRSLPDGTTVEVVSIEGTSAEVRVSRPGDVSPPAMPPEALGECVAFACTVSTRGALWETGRATYDIPLSLMDDYWISRMSVNVRGTSSQDISVIRQAPGVQGDAGRLPSTLTLGAGNYSVAIQAGDMAGASSTGLWQLRLPTPTVTKKPWFQLNAWLSYAWPSYSQLRCWHDGENCIGVAVRAERTCPRTVTARLSYRTKEETALETRVVTIPSLKARASTMMVAVFSREYAAGDHFSLDSLTCGRR